MGDDGLDTLCTVANSAPLAIVLFATTPLPPPRWIACPHAHPATPPGEGREGQHCFLDVFLAATTVIFEAFARADSDAGLRAGRGVVAAFREVVRRGCETDDRSVRACCGAKEWAFLEGIFSERSDQLDLDADTLTLAPEQRWGLFRLLLLLPFDLDDGPRGGTREGKEHSRFLVGAARLLASTLDRERERDANDDVKDDSAGFLDAVVDVLGVTSGGSSVVRVQVVVPNLKRLFFLLPRGALWGPLTARASKHGACATRTRARDTRARTFTRAQNVYTHNGAHRPTH